MSDVIMRAEGLGKKYVIGHQSAERELYTSLRDVIERSVKSLGRSAIDMISGKQIIAGDEFEEFWALKDVNFEIKRGDVVGIIGRNGSGKSTLLKILSRITEPSSGRVQIKGRVASLLEVGTGFHPELTGRENIYLNGAILGMSRAEIKQKFDEIVDFSGVEKFVDTPVKRYSSGMYVRLAFAVAAHLEPEILIVDEVLSVGDAEFQKKCLRKIEDFAGEGRSVLFVSHNLASVATLATSAILLNSGSMICFGSVEKTIDEYAKFHLASNLSTSRTIRHFSGHCVLEDALIESEAGASVIEWQKPFTVSLYINVLKECTLSPELLIKGPNKDPILFCPSGLYLGWSKYFSVGRHKITMKSDGLELAIGNYYVDVALANSGINFFAYYEDQLNFSVQDRPYGKFNWYYTQRHKQGFMPIRMTIC